MHRGDADQFAKLTGSLMTKRDAGIYLVMGRTPPTLGMFSRTNSFSRMLEGSRRSVRARMKFFEARPSHSCSQGPDRHELESALCQPGLCDIEA